MVGVKVGMLIKFGMDFFVDMVFLIWLKVGVMFFVLQYLDGDIGVVYIFVDDVIGDNVIIVCFGIVVILGFGDVDVQ